MTKKEIWKVYLRVIQPRKKHTNEIICLLHKTLKGLKEDKKFWEELGYGTVKYFELKEVPTDRKAEKNVA